MPDSPSTKPMTIAAGIDIASRFPRRSGEASHEYANRLHAEGHREDMAARRAASRSSAPPAQTAEATARPSSPVSQGIQVAPPKLMLPKASSFTSYLPTLEGGAFSAPSSREDIIASEFALSQASVLTLRRRESSEAWDGIVSDMNMDLKRSMPPEAVSFTGYLSAPEHSASSEISSREDVFASEFASDQASAVTSRHRESSDAWDSIVSDMNTYFKK